jgi:ABC-2 type transport system permease protein
MDWGQLRSIIWLRWRLSRNQWSRAGQLGAIITITVLVICLIIGIGGGFVGTLVGTFALVNVSPQKMLIVWDIIVIAFLFFWMTGIMTEIQRSETIDINRMLHLPVSLKEIFLINYVASHLTLSIIVFMPVMLGLSLGLTIGRQLSMAWMFPLVLGFIFMITAWTYCLRGWLATLMVNKRKRRAVIALVTFSFIVLVQLPNIIGNLVRDHKKHRPDTMKSAPLDEQATKRPEGRERKSIPNAVLVAHKVVPFLWVGNGAMSLVSDHIWPAILGAAGAFGIGGLGLRRAYRTTFRFYQGRAVSRKSLKKPKSTKADAARKNLLERRLPGIPDEAASLATAVFRSLIRAPEVKMAMATNFFMLLFLGTMIFVRRAATIGDAFKPFLATGTIAFTFLGMSQLMFNHFGYDRGAFRQLVLLPAQRKWILLGKNLAFLPFALVMEAIILVIIMIALHISLITLLAVVLQLVTAFLIVSIAGNLLSILIPYRIAPGSLKRTKTSSTTSVLIFLSRLLFPTIMIPIFIPPAMGLLLSRLGWLPAEPVNLLFSAILLGLLVLLYRLSLVPLGKLLLRHEKQILQAVTEKVE